MSRPTPQDELAGMITGYWVSQMVHVAAPTSASSRRPTGAVHADRPVREFRSDVPGSQWAMAVMMGDEHYKAGDDLLESVRTVETAFDRLHGKPIFEDLGERPEQAEVFDAAMTSIHGRETQAAAILDRAGLSGRCELVGDVFGSIPVRADADFLRHIIHDWDDEKAGLILRNGRKSMPKGPRLLVVEHLLPPGHEPTWPSDP